MSKGKDKFMPGYPLDSFLADGTTDDDQHCPRCGSGKIGLVDVEIASGQQIGVCKNCTANFIVNPPPWSVTSSMWPLETPDEESPRFPKQRIYCHTLANAEAIYQLLLAWRGIKAVQLWEGTQKLKEVYGP